MSQTGDPGFRSGCRPTLRSSQTCFEVSLGPFGAPSRYQERFACRQQTSGENFHFFPSGSSPLFGRGKRRSSGCMLEERVGLTKIIAEVGHVKSSKELNTLVKA
eukprot:1345463-Amorphochlora_amoeboformis.AAC.1